MKTLKLLSIALAGAFMISSCSTSSSFTKRRYTKGIYVHHKGEPTQPQVHRSAAPAVVQTNDHASAITVAKQPHHVAAPVAARSEAAPARPMQKKSASPKPAVAEPLVANAQTMLEMAPAPKFRALNDSQIGVAGPSDGYSLLWIIIVVLAVLYLIGLLTGGFGLGPIIHVLIIVAVVLLILWLLKVI